MSFSVLLALKSTLLKTKVIKFGYNKKCIYLDKHPIEIILEYKYLGIDFYLHGYFEPSSKRQKITCMKALMNTLRK